MKILFVLTLLILVILFIIVKKSKQKLNLTEWTIIGIVMLLGYNTIIYYIFYLSKVSINLINFSIINIAFIVVLMKKIIKDKQCQEFYFDKQEIIQKVFIAIIVIIVCICNFGTKLHIKYASKDGATHCKAVIQFSESEELPKDFKGFMPMAYVNTGLIIKTFSSKIENIKIYKIFIIFDIFVLILIALTMNSILIKYCKKTSSKIVAMFITILYTLGYPLNSVFYGFSYLSISIVVINTIFIFMQNYSNNKLMSKINILCIFILNFSLFFSYYLYVPVIYGAEILYILSFNIRQRKLLQKYRKNKSKKEKINSRKIAIKKLLIMIIICIIIPLQYHVFYEKEQFEQLLSGIQVEGYIYENILSNFFIILPISLYIFLKEKKKHNYIYYALILMILYMILISFIVVLGKISFYYFIKNLFVLWGICGVIICNKIIKLIKQKDIITIPIYIILTSIFIAFSNIYYENLSIIQNKYEYKVIYTDDELEVLEKSKELVNYSDSVSIIGNHLKRCWATVFTEYSNASNEIKFEEANYIIYFYNANISKEYMDNLISNMDLLYENESGAIYRKKL